MRCTRCDGLAVPQAVGVDPRGNVVFGWCLQCLADRGCTLVEDAPGDPWRFSSQAVVGGAARLTPGERRRLALSSALAIDQTQWVVAVVAFLMMTWGLLLLTAGLWYAPRFASGANPLGNGTPAFLVWGGSAKALLGVSLMVLASRRNWYPGAFLLSLLSWLALVLGLGMLARGVLADHPGRKTSLGFGIALCLGISVLTRAVRLAQRRKSAPAGAPAILRAGPDPGRSRAGDRGRMQ